ncbi:decreased expression in renal and prostate cancer protein-like [Cervus elaphus]|uniref:decreased expression in renal and prostate cancer protein-like n=1 Tax=Cervus elaphus TaxID=9860 RepID=UPI001CC2BC1D|nr:decreased expression in renal and prostate cancer protein-like [Cervus elaphus]
MVALGLPGGFLQLRPGPGAELAAGAVSAAGPSPGFLGLVGVVPSCPRGSDKMEDIVSPRSHDGSGGRLPTGMRGREALSVLGARGAPPPAFQTPAPARVAEAPARPGLTGLPDTGYGGLGGHRGLGTCSRCEGRWPGSGLRAAGARQRSATAASNRPCSLRRAGPGSGQKRRGVQQRRGGVACS